jgi:hypothetical protein
MCELSPQQLAARGRNARNSFSKRYDLEENAMKLLQLLERLRGGPKTMPFVQSRQPTRPSLRANSRYRTTTFKVKKE